MTNINKDSNIAIIKEVISRLLPGSRVVLFGSRAVGNFNDKSDYDVLIITKYNFQITEKLKMKSQIRKELANYLIPVDVFIESEEEVSTISLLTNHVVNEAVLKGVTIWIWKSLNMLNNGLKSTGRFWCRRNTLGIWITSL